MATVRFRTGTACSRFVLFIQFALRVVSSLLPDLLICNLLLAIGPWSAPYALLIRSPLFNFALRSLRSLLLSICCRCSFRFCFQLISLLTRVHFRVYFRVRFRRRSRFAFALLSCIVSICFRVYVRFHVRCHCRCYARFSSALISLFIECVRSCLRSRPLSRFTFVLCSFDFRFHVPLVSRVTFVS